MGRPLPSIACRIIEHFNLCDPSNVSDCQLTKREAEVLTLIARGLRNAEVAEILGLAHTTVASYIKSVYRKLGISCRAKTVLALTKKTT